MLSVYKASAGSGKTFSLVKELLKILLSSNDKYSYKKILAITFTNKASIEMKDRVLKSLIEFSTNDISKNLLFLSLKEEMGINEISAKNKSREIVKQIIHNYSLFSISTIDKFTYRLVKTFSKDLGLSSDFTPEINADEIVYEATDVFISKISEEKNEINKILKNFIRYNLKDGKSLDITKNIKDLSKVILDDKGYENLKKLNLNSLSDFIDYYENLIKECKDIETEILLKSKNILSKLEENNLTPKDLKGGVKGIICIIINRISKGNISDIFTEANLKFIEGEGVLYKKDKNYDIIESITPYIMDNIRGIKDNQDTFNKNKFILKNLYSIALLKEIEKELNLIKENNNIVTLSEFNKIIKESIKDEPIPFIYERLGERYNYFFIDEFQDTSLFQWENLKPLIDNQISGKGISMIVGDSKQSIYRWRGGESSQFIDLADLNKSYNNGEINKKIFSLDTNYRSSKNVVNFCNDFFTQIANFFTQENFKKIYTEENKQKVNSKNEGYVSINLINNDNSNEDYNEDDRYLETKKYKNTLNETLKEIKKLLEEGWKKKDICILVRRNDQGVLISNKLEENGINIISSETLLLNISNEIKLIISILKLLLDRNNSKNIRYEVVNNLYRLDIIDENLYNYHLKIKDNNFLKFIENISGIDSIINLLDKNIYDICFTLIKSFNFKINNPYISFFMDDILDFTLNNKSDLGNYIEYWDLKGNNKSISVSGEIDAVNIMTIHKSKGLEFPVVILPFLNSKSKNEYFWKNIKGDKIEDFYLEQNKKMNKNSIFKEDIEKIDSNKLFDDINLLYVALTRAKEQLHIITTKTKKGDRVENKFIDYYLEKTGEKVNDIVEFGSRKILEKKDIKEIDSNDYKISIDDKYWTSKVRLSFEGISSDFTKTNSAILLGNIFHNIMSKLKFKDDFIKVKNIISSIYDISEQEKKYLLSNIKNIISNKELEKYYTKEYQVFTEKDIFYNGKILRLDRICIKENEAIIIDYKTGKKETKNIKQVEEYSEALVSIGYNVSSKILIYIEDNKIEVEKVKNINLNKG